MGIFMKVDGIKGSATAKGYTDWSALQRTNFVVQRDIPLVVGSTNNRYTIPAFQHLIITKAADASSSVYSALCARGIVISTIQFDLCRTDDSLEPYLQYTLHNVLVAHVEDIATAASGTMEKLLLNYTKIDKRYVLSNSSGQSQSPASMSFDLPTAKVS